MTCSACEAAWTDCHSGLYQANCQGCQVRALAKSMAFSDSQRKATITREYRKALHSIFKGDVAGGHEKVKAEAARLKEVRDAG